MKKSLAFVAAVLFGLAPTTGAVAADPKDGATPGASATPAAKSERARSADPRYCVLEVRTGSHITKKICKTRSEWIAEGVDPLNP
jgi:hypothetical protein